MEISDAVYNIILKENITSYKKRELILEKSINDFISELNVKTPSYIKRINKSQKKNNFIFKDKINFFDESDFYIFKKSQEFKDLNPDNRIKFVKYIKKATVPYNKRGRFNFKIMKILMKHHEDEKLMSRIRKLKNSILKSNNNPISVKEDYKKFFKIPHHYATEFIVKNNFINELIQADICETENICLNNKKKDISEINSADEFIMNDQSLKNLIHTIDGTKNNLTDNGKVIKKIYLNDNAEIKHLFNEKNLNFKNNSIIYCSKDLNNEITKTDKYLIDENEKDKSGKKHFNTVDLNYYEDKKKLSNEYFKTEVKPENNSSINNTEEIDIAVDDILKIIKRELSDEL